MQSIEALFTYAFFLIITAAMVHQEYSLYTGHYQAALASDAWRVFALKSGAYEDFNETLAQSVAQEIEDKTATCFALSDECSFKMDRYVIKDSRAIKIKVSFG